jgi:hypothetical protein
MNAMNYIYKTIKRDTIYNQVECLNNDNFLTMETIQKSINSIDMRRDWIDKGKKDAQIFLEKIRNNSEKDFETTLANTDNL